MTRTLWIAFALVFAVGLAAFAPLRIVLEGANRAGLALSAERVSGSIWGGEAHAAHLHGVDLGDLRLSLDPLGFLRGAVTLGFQADGALEGAGALRFGARQFGLERFTGSAPIETLGLSLPLSGRISASRLTVVMGDGACREAAGQISTDAFETSAAAIGLRGPPLTGDATCGPDGAMTAALTGTDASASITATLNVFADGRFTLETRIAPKDPSLGGGLALAGFAPGPEGFSRTDQGMFSATSAP